jgi:hypothetical protein
MKKMHETNKLYKYIRQKNKLALKSRQNISSPQIKAKHKLPLKSSHMDGKHQFPCKSANREESRGLVKM